MIVIVVVVFLGCSLVWVLSSDVYVFVGCLKGSMEKKKEWNLWFVSVNWL